MFKRRLDVAAITVCSSRNQIDEQSSYFFRNSYVVLSYFLFVTFAFFRIVSSFAYSFIFLSKVIVVISHRIFS